MQLNWLAIAEEIDDLYLGDAEVWRRAYVGDAGPLGGDFPIVTSDGHNILDVIFTSPIPSLGGKKSFYSHCLLLKLMQCCLFVLVEWVC